MSEPRSTGPFLQNHRWSLLLMLAGMLVCAAIYLPGLSGPWLVDDEVNLGMFNHYLPGQAPYADIIRSNPSGPLGRAVSIATFASNHALGLFSTHALKATNLIIHLLNGLLLFFLLNRLFCRRAPAPLPALSLLAAGISIWWLLLPIHISTVLYIVQRMTQVSTFFSLAACLAYVTGRDLLATQPVRGRLTLAGSLLLLLPLAVFAKESGISCIAFIVLIELFFFTAISKTPKRLLLPLSVIVIVLALAGAAVALSPPQFISDGYIGRDFSLSDRLLTQPRVLFSYIHDIFLPNSAHMGLYQDDFTISHGALSPLTTLPALLGLACILFIALGLADSPRWWPLSFGLLFYFSGQLLESTLIPLELYFEHRNYLPAAGLLLAATTAVLTLWPWRRPLLIFAFAAYLALLAIATFQRTFIWGDKGLLLESSATNHPGSTRAGTDHAEYLLAQRQIPQALNTTLRGAERNHDFAAIYYLQAISIYCRVGDTPPEALIQHAAKAMEDLGNYTASLSIGLNEVLTRKQKGHCGHADFQPLAAALPAVDTKLRQQYGDARHRIWLTRFTISQWLSDNGQDAAALAILSDIWAQENKASMPTVGLMLAQALAKANDLVQMQRVLNEIDQVTDDAPPEFRQEMDALRKIATGNP